MKFKLNATVGGQTVEYGPWDTDPDPVVNAGRVSYAMGFVAGVYSAGGEDRQASDLTFEVIAVEESQQIGAIHAYAEATVTRAADRQDES